MNARVILVPFSASDRSDTKSEFERVGWAVDVYIPDTWLHESLCRDPAAVVVASGAWQQIRASIAELRTALPRSMLIALLDEEGTKEMRIEAINLGADACYPASCHSAELVAFAVTGFRRIGPAYDAWCDLRFASVRKTWRLDPAGRLWLGPKGEVLPLTVTEFEFLNRLLSAPGKRLSRMQFSSEANGNIPGKTPPTQREISRRTDVLVSRLRSKAEGLGIKVPLLAIRQWGYVFMDEYELR